MSSRFDEFRKSLPSRPGTQVLMCPKCHKIVKHYPVKVTKLNDYAYEIGYDPDGKRTLVNYTFDGRGCCF